MPTTPAQPILLIAVTGAPGEGKTRLLTQLAAHVAAQGQRIEGFVSVAEGRAQPELGATHYHLQLLGSDEVLPWAERDNTRFPPYRLEPETLAWLHTWAAGLPRHAPLLVMDEFGRFEARGDGLMATWPAVAATAPLIVMLAVREGLLEAIEDKLGRKFDLIVPATAPDALAQLQAACAAYGEWTRIGLFGGAAGGIEMTVGSAFHALNLPLRGLALSSLQSAMMTFAARGLQRPARVIWMPFIAAGLKALSPAGSRVRPMVAISAQGALYGGAVQLLGWNLLGVTVAGALVGTWCALQGFALQYLMLGQEIQHAYAALAGWLMQHWHLQAPGLFALLGAWTALHVLVVAGLTLVAWRLRAPPAALQRVIARESARTPTDAIAPAGAPPVVSAWRRAGRDLTRWQFWLPLLLVSAILLASGRTWESVAWLVLRGVAVALVLLSLLSLFRPRGLADFLRRRGWWGPALALDGALQRRSGSR